MRTAIFPARFDQLDPIREFINQATADAGMDESGRCAVEMAVDEACSNIIEHAYIDDKDGEIECSCDHNDKKITIILRDHGCPFDIDSVPLPDLDDKLEDRKVGGLGVYLIHELMDEVQYVRTDRAGNILTLKRKLKSKK